MNVSIRSRFIARGALFCLLFIAFFIQSCGSSTAKKTEVATPEKSETPIITVAINAPEFLSLKGDNPGHIFLQSDRNTRFLLEKSETIVGNEELDSKEKHNWNILVLNPEESKKYEAFARKNREAKFEIAANIEVANDSIAAYRMEFYLKQGKGEFKPNRTVEFVPAMASGITAFNAEEYEKAIGYFEKMLEVSPKSSNTWVYMGRCHQKMKNYDKASEAFQRAASFNPKSVSPWLRMIELYREQNNLGMVEYSFKKAIKVRPNDSLLRTRMGLFYQKNKANALASDQFLEATKLDPENLEAWKGLGMSYLKDKLFGRAEKAIKKALELESGNPALWYQLGETFMYRKKWDQASEAYSKVLDINSNHMDAMSALGIIHVMKSEFDKAEPIFKKVLAAAPDNKKLRKNVEKLYLTNGDHHQREGDKEKMCISYQQGCTFESAKACEKQKEFCQ